MENATVLRDAILREAAQPTPGSTFLQDLRDGAVRATLGGVGSADWRLFMTVFADNEQQLQRLTVSDGVAGASYVRETSAYLVGGSICTDITTGHLLDRLDERIDSGINPASDGKIQKWLRIPPPPVQNP